MASTGSDMQLPPMLESMNIPFNTLAISAVPLAAAAGCICLYSFRKKLVLWTYSTLRWRKQRRGTTFLKENYAPVSEEQTLTALEVEGSIPKELNGMFVRNGPNPYFQPLNSYHWFDGDGMLHGVRLKDGSASYCNRFVQTARLAQEKTVGWPYFSKLGDMWGVTGLGVVLMNALMKKMGVIDAKSGEGTANTSVVFHAKKLLATHEGDLPYQIRVLCNGVLETVGRLRMKDWNTAFTAHPKIDPETGKMHFFGYNGDTAPFVQYGQMGADGSLEAISPVNIPDPVMMHDFAITKNFAVFLDLPLVIEPKVMIKENRIPIMFKEDRVSRIGLLPLGSTDDAAMQWFELPSFMVFHVVNAWEEEDGTVQVFACQFDKITLDLEELSPDDMQQLYRYTLDPKTGVASSKMVSPVNGDFPVVHPALVGRKTRFTYLATYLTKEKFEVDGLTKAQLYGLPEGEDAAIAQISLPDGCTGGEAVFVPRHQDLALCDGEDDGFLLLFVYYPQDDASRLHIYDAKTMSPEPLAVVKLPVRVPYGFHGTFITEEQLQQQVA